MTTEQKVKVIEFTGEVLMGVAFGIISGKVTKDCTKTENVLVTVSGCVACWTIGRAWAKSLMNLSDACFGTEFNASTKY